jgi:hypothetical protein
MLIRRKRSNFFLNEIIKLEDEVVIFGIVFGMVHGTTTRRIPQKNPPNLLAAVHITGRRRHYS